MQIKLGCDPEAFLIDNAGQLRSSIGLIGGTKEQPLPLPIGEGYAVQEDNVAIEFNIPPASSRSEYVHSIQQTLGFLLHTVNEKYGFTISKDSAALFPESELQSEAAMVFGCDPDFNAWNGLANPRPKATDKTLRSCGGHIHVGFDKTVIESEGLIKAMDLFLGVPSVLMDNGDLRKQLYGKAGAFRDKPYGAEYRTLSNFWIFKTRLIEWAWDNTSKALAFVESRNTISKGEGKKIVECINNNDRALASKLVSKYGLEVVSV